MWSRDILRKKLDEAGITPSRAKGQNFMTDPNFLSYMVDTSEAGEGDTVLEIGTGAGHLTTTLLDQGARVIGVEIDSRLVELTRDHTNNPDSLSLFTGDILKSKQINPSFQSFLDNCLQDESLTLISNLPYRRGVQILIAMVESDLPLDEGYVVLQTQLAEKLSAEGGTSQYGTASVLFQWHAKLESIRSVAKPVFWPQPEVPSSFCRIIPDGWIDLDTSRPEYEQMKDIVNVLFRHPRKTLRNNLRLADSFTPSDAGIYEDFLQDIFLRKRPEHVTPQEWYELAEKLIDKP